MTETSTTNLTDFLLARFAEDEERAEFVRRQNEGPWHRPFETWKLAWHDEYDLLCLEPERALAECEGKRRIVRRSQNSVVLSSGHWNKDALALLTASLRDLALPYADHPDYREEWRP